MKLVLVCIIFLLGMGACGSSGTSSPAVVKADTVVIYVHDTINSTDISGVCQPYATVAGVYGGKVSKGDLLHCGGLRLLNNRTDYKIISFKCTNETFKYDSEHFSSQNFGSAFNVETMKMFDRLQAAATLSFENIKAVGVHHDTIILNSIIVHLPT